MEYDKYVIDVCPRQVLFNQTQSVLMYQSIESLGGGAGTWPRNTVLLLNTA